MRRNQHRFKKSKITKGRKMTMIKITRQNIEVIRAIVIITRRTLRSRSIRRDDVTLK